MVNSLHYCMVIMKLRNTVRKMHKMLSTSVIYFVTDFQAPGANYSILTTTKKKDQCRFHIAILTSIFKRKKHISTKSAYLLNAYCNTDIISEPQAT